MAQPIFSNSLPVAILSVVRSVASCVIAAVTLYVLLMWQGAGREEIIRDISVVALVFGLILVRPMEEADARAASKTAWTTFRLILRHVLAFGALVPFGIATGYSMLTPELFALWALTTTALSAALNVLVVGAMQRALIGFTRQRRAVFAGYNEASTKLAETFLTDKSLCMQPLAFFDDRSAERLGVEPGTLQGKLTDTGDYVRRNAIDVIFVALPVRHIQRVMDLLDELRDTTASIYYVPDIFVFDMIQARFQEINGVPVLAMCETPFYGFRGIMKRAMDMVIAGVGVLLLSPFLLLIAAAVKFSSPGPVIFKQRRYGLDGREIVVFKFRSMRVQDDGAQIRQASMDDDRTTRIGRLLRKSSLDELPQLFNVLQGRMSIVGPRPHAVAHNEMYRKLIKGYMIRHKVRPGITGLAQVNGCRGETSQLEDMEARIRFDLAYLRHWSLLMDIRIILLTFRVVLKAEKAY